MTSVPVSLPTEGSRLAGAESRLARVSATRWLIACDDVAWADGVAAALRARGATVFLLDAEGAGVQRLATAEAQVLLLHRPPSPALRGALHGYPGVRWATPLVVRPLRLWPLQSNEPEVDALAREARAAWLPDRTVCSWAHGNESRLRVDYAALGAVRLLRALSTTPGGTFQVQLSTVDVFAQVTLSEGQVTGALYEVRAANTACRDTLAALRHVLELGAAECEITRQPSLPVGQPGMPLAEALHQAFEWLDAQRYGALADEPTLRAQAPSSTQARPAPDTPSTTGKLRIPSTPVPPRLSLPLPPVSLPRTLLDLQVLPAQGKPPPLTRPLRRPLPSPPTSSQQVPPPLPARGRAGGMAETPYPPLLRARTGLPRRWIQVGAAAAIACGTFGFLSLLGGGDEATVTAEPTVSSDPGEPRDVSAAGSEPSRPEVERMVEPLAVEPSAAAGVGRNPFDVVQARGTPSTPAEPVPQGLVAKSRRLAREAHREMQVDRVRALYEEALALDPDNPRALAGLASVELKAGKLGSARSLAERAVHLRTGRYAYRMLLGRVASEQGDWDAAVVAYQEALECRPKSSAAHRGLARARSDGSTAAIDP